MRIDSLLKDTKGISNQHNLDLGPMCKAHEVNMHMLKGETIFYYEDEKLLYLLLQEKPFLKAFLLKEKKETIALVYYLLFSLPLFILYR